MFNLKNEITDKIGSDLLDIEEIHEKEILPSNDQELQERRKRSKDLVNKKAMLSSGATVIPIPGLDFGVDMKLMKDIVEDVNKIYGVDHKHVNSFSDDVKERIMSAAAIQGSQVIGKRVSGALIKLLVKDVAKRTAVKQTRWFPIIGQTISAGVSYYFMMKLGNDHIEKCEKVTKSLM
ncbi:DUF697 domain-containing protein [Staphylococcus massiliensis]|uniref:DUF697 domain-containing protein n=1 Tax=Staphylococcus massiliensis TaxID=555791 RepID=UPI001EDDCF1B|nr:DUF697 domain-containing protein [Staphylococcus massiliensis]MCG3401508.1 DUF697 domain-containing protein [Staphylococcus massiliensis]